MKNLIQEEISEIKYLFGYKRGVVISEQIPNIKKVNQSDYIPKSDYLGAGGQFQQNNTRQTSKQSIDNQIENNPELKAKSDLEKANIKLKKDFEVLKVKYVEEIPYKEYYTSNNKLFQNWVQQKIKNLNPTQFAKSNFLNNAINFFKKYFDYKSKPEIINKIITISKKNGVSVSADKVKHEIDNLISTYLPSVSFKLDFDYNEKEPSTMMYVYPSLVDGIVYICPLNNFLFGKGYDFGNYKIWEETVLHEIGHLVDGYFNENGIKFHSSDNGKPSSNKKSVYPHSSSSSSFLDFDKIFPDPDSDTEIDYRTNKLEQFTRFKVLFDTLSKKGLKINSNLSKFIDSFKQCLYDYIIMIGYEGCKTKIENGILILDETCESLNTVESKKDFLPIYVNFSNNSSLYWLFSYYTTINIIKPTRYPEKNKIKYSIDLNKMYNDWKNEYVMNTQEKQSKQNIPDFPSA